MISSRPIGDTANHEANVIVRVHSESLSPLPALGGKTSKVGQSIIDCSIGGKPVACKSKHLEAGTYKVTIWPGDDAVPSVGSNSVVDISVKNSGVTETVGCPLRVLGTAEVQPSFTNIDKEISGFISAYTAQQNALLRGDVLICAEELYNESTEGNEGILKEGLLLARFCFDREKDQYKCYSRVKARIHSAKKVGDERRIAVSDYNMGATVQAGKIHLVTPGRTFGTYEFAGPESFEKHLGMTYIALENLGFYPFGQYSSQCGRKNAASFQSSVFRKSFVKNVDGRQALRLSRTLPDSKNGITRSDVIWEWDEQLLVPLKMSSIAFAEVNGKAVGHLNYEETYEWGTFEGLPVIRRLHRRSFDAVLFNDQVVKPLKTVDVSFHWFAVNQEIPPERFAVASLRDAKLVEESIDRRQMESKDILTLAE